MILHRAPSTERIKVASTEESVLCLEYGRTEDYSVFSKPNTNFQFLWKDARSLCLVLCQPGPAQFSQSK